jgi:hypothetical protein
VKEVTKGDTKRELDLQFRGSDERMTKNRLVFYEEHMLFATLDKQFLLCVRDARNSNQVGGSEEK